MPVQRLQKIIAACGLASRREAERWIKQGRISVNGKIATLGESADLDVDCIAVNGKEVGKPQRKTYILLNKPSGYVTTMRDPEGRPVVSALLQGVDERVVPVGRLDLTTEGLLLLTNDGDLAQRLAHPKFHVAKTYLVRARGVVDRSLLNRLEKGVSLDDGMTAPARAELVRQVGTHSWVKITIYEGRNRQVRRMFETLGFPVSRLKRIGYAFLDDMTLKPGQFRHLTAAEVTRLKTLGAAS